MSKELEKHGIEVDAYRSPEYVVQQIHRDDDIMSRKNKKG